jgi:hypothetical protein
MPDRRPIGAGATSIGPAPRQLPDDPSLVSVLESMFHDPLGVGQGSQIAMAPHLPPAKLYNAGDRVSPTNRLSRLRPFAPLPPVDAASGATPASDVPPSLMEMLGRVFTGGKGTKLTDRLRLTGYDPQQNTATLHSTTANTEYTSPLDEMLGEYKKGTIVPELPEGAMEGQPIEAMIARLVKVLGK